MANEQSTAIVTDEQKPVARVYVIHPPGKPRSVVYVGATRSQLQVRVNTHRQNVRGGRREPVCSYLRELMTAGEWPDFEVIEECDPAILYDREHYWIAHYRSTGHRLLNVTAGGHDNSMHHAEVRAKVSIALTGRRLSEEHRAKIGALKKGHTFRRGAKSSIETKRKVAVAVKRLWEDPAYRAKMIEARHRMWSNPEYRAHMQAVHRKIR